MIKYHFFVSVIKNFNYEVVQPVPHHLSHGTKCSNFFPLKNKEYGTG